jgi:hypothetical protein
MSGQAARQVVRPACRLSALACVTCPGSFAFLFYDRAWVGEAALTAIIHATLPV